MRLLQFTASGVWRGHEQKILYLYDAYIENPQIEDQFILCANNTPIYDRALDEKMNVIGFDYQSEYSFKTARMLVRLVKEKQIDVVLLHNSKAHTLAVLAHLLFGLPATLVLCRTLIERVDTNFFRKWKYNYTGIKKIICVSQAVVDVLTYAVKDTTRMTIVGSVSDHKKFEHARKNGKLHSEFNIEEGFQIIGNIAAFSPFKDHYTWVDTVEQLINRGLKKARYILIGEGRLMPEIKAYVAQKGLNDYIIFTGFRKDIPDLLIEFDLFLFTSDNEPTGGVLLECYAAGIPIVAANAGGIPEVIVNGETGLLAEVGNPVDFADKVLNLLHDSSLQDRLTKNGYRHLMENFTKKVISDKFFNIMNQVSKSSDNS